MKRGLRDWQRPGSSQPRRSGALLLEVVVAGSLLATILIVVAPVMRLTRVQVREADHRLVALAEASNTLDRLCRLPLTELTAGEPTDATHESPALNRLPDGRLTVHVEPVAEIETGRRITVEVRYRDAWDQPVLPVRLVGWRLESELDPEDQP